MGREVAGFRGAVKAGFGSRGFRNDPGPRARVHMGVRYLILLREVVLEWVRAFALGVFRSGVRDKARFRCGCAKGLLWEAVPKTVDSAGGTNDRVLAIEHLMASLRRLHLRRQNLETCGTEPDCKRAFEPTSQLEINACHGLRRKEHCIPMKHNKTLQPDCCDD